MTRLDRNLVAIVLNPALVNHHPALMADAFLKLVEDRGGVTRMRNLTLHAPDSVQAKIARTQCSAGATIRAMLGKPALHVIEGRPRTTRGKMNLGLAAHFARQMTDTPGPDAA